MDALSKAPIEQVPIAGIVVGPRRRKAVTRLGGLKRSIADHGLIHPILLRAGVLVSGARRLAACAELGWETIPAKSVDKLSDEEFRALELTENVERTDLDDYETSKQRLAEIRQEEAEAKAEEVSGPPRATNSKGGRPRGRRPGSGRSAAAASGVPRATIQRLETHVALAEAHPFMQRDGWTQGSVLKAGEALKGIPKAEHKGVAVLLDQPAIPPKAAVQILSNLAAMPKEERAEIYEGAKSQDQHERSNALAAAAKLPPMPDPGVLLLVQARDLIRKAEKATKQTEYRERIAELEKAAQQLIDGIEAASKEAINGNG